jgi:hypothetical protein
MNGFPQNIVQRNEFLRLLETPEAIHFLKDNWNEDPYKLTLKSGAERSFDVRVASKILHLYHKAERKLPLWVANFLALDPRSFEQATAENVAKLKMNLIQGESLLELSSGLGVDSSFLSQSFNQVISLDINPELIDISSYNDYKLGITNIRRVHDDAANWKNYLNETTNTIYVDPDRRTQDGIRTKGLEESMPPILDWLPEMLQSNCVVYIKCSPLIDLNYVKQRVPNATEIYVISSGNEVKEVLLKVEKETPHHIYIEAIDITSAGAVLKFNSIQTLVEAETVRTGQFVLEPGAALRKAKLSDSYAQMLGAKSISPMAPYYASSNFCLPFQGRVFEQQSKGKLSWKLLKKSLKTAGIKQANILRKGFVESAESIRKRLNIKEGGDLFLLFVIDEQGMGEVYHLRKI